MLIRFHTRIVYLLVLLGVGMSLLYFFRVMQRPQQNQALFEAIYCHDSQSVVELLAQGVNPNVTGAPSPHYSFMQRLSHLFHPVKFRQRSPCTALWFAVSDNSDGEHNFKNAAIIRALLDAGANPNLPDDPPDSLASTFIQPLNMAILDKDHTTIRLLLEHHAAINTPSYIHGTPLLCATLYGDPDIVEILLHYGAKPNIPEATDQSNGWTPLFYSICYDSPLEVKMLLTHGADINHKDFEGKTALTYALEHRDRYRNKKIEKFLRKAGVKE